MTRSNHATQMLVEYILIGLVVSSLGQIEDALAPCSRPANCPEGDLRPDPEDCSKFYECNKGGHWKRQPCKDQTFFDRENLTCVSEEFVRCQEPCLPIDDTSDTSQSTTKAPYSFEACNLPPTCDNSTILPDPDDCSSYLLCINNKWNPVPCTSSKNFDYLINKCLPPQEARCHPDCSSLEALSTTQQLNQRSGLIISTTVPTPQPEVSTTKITTPAIDAALISTICSKIGRKCDVALETLPVPGDCSRFYFCFQAGGNWASIPCSGEGKMFDIATMKCATEGVCMPVCLPETTPMPTTTTTTYIGKDILSTSSTMITSTSPTSPTSTTTTTIPTTTAAPTTTTTLLTTEPLETTSQATTTEPPTTSTAATSTETSSSREMPKKKKVPTATLR